MRAVLLDRDGVINVDRDGYVRNTSELNVFPFAPAAIRRLNRAGLPVFVVSNQQGVAKGVVSRQDLQAIEDEIRRQVEDAGGRITRFYYCKHLASSNCSCRKPQSGLLLLAAAENGVELTESFMVGDTERDILAGRAAGCTTILVLTGMLDREAAARLAVQPDHTASDLSEAADIILGLVEGFPSW